MVHKTRMSPVQAATASSSLIYILLWWIIEGPCVFHPRIHGILRWGLCCFSSESWNLSLHSLNSRWSTLALIILIAGQTVKQGVESVPCGMPCLGDVGTVDQVKILKAFNWMMEVMQQVIPASWTTVHCQVDKYMRLDYSFQHILTCQVITDTGARRAEDLGWLTPKNPTAKGESQSQ